MKENNRPLLKYITSICMLLALSHVSLAQKLPKIQSEGVRVPSNLMSRSSIQDQDISFKAYNTSTDLYYVVANDDNNIYITLKASLPAIIKKAIMGGITFSVNNNSQKSFKNSASVSFPNLSIKEASEVIVSWRRKPGNMNDSLIKARLTDSTMKITSRLLNNRIKEIYVIGLKGISDSTISVYNDQNIIAKVNFNSRGEYIYQLAVPLKYFGLSIKDRRNFVYNIRVNAIDIRNVESAIVSGIKSVSVINGQMTVQGPGAAEVSALTSTTDTWGEYVLATK